MFAEVDPPVLAISLQPAVRDEIAFAARLCDGFNELGQRLLLLDLSGGQIAQALGAPTRFDLAQVLTGAVSMHQACVAQGPAIKLLSIRRAHEQGLLARDWARYLVRATSTEHWSADRIVVLGDAAPVASLSECFDLPMLLLGRLDQSGLSATYQRIKQIEAGYGVNRYAMVYLRVRDMLQAAKGHDYLCQMTRRFLGVDLQLAGLIREQAQTRSFRDMAHMLMEPDSMQALS